MSDEIIKVIDVLAAKLGIAIDWAEANVMPSLQQLMGRYIDYEIAMSTFWIISLFVVTIIFVVVTCLLYPKAKKYNFSEAYGVCWAYMFSITIACIFTTTFVIVSFVQAVNIITCTILPEKVIFEYLKGMM